MFGVVRSVISAGLIGFVFARWGFLILTVGSLQADGSRGNYNVVNRFLYDMIDLVGPVPVGIFFLVCSALGTYWFLMQALGRWRLHRAGLQNTG